MNPTTEKHRRSWILSTAVILAFSGCLASSDSPDVTLEKANILSDRGRYDDAIPVYSKAIESFQDRADAYFKRGVCYEQLQLFEKALADYTKCLELDPEYSDAINNKGVVLAQMKQFQAAADQFSLLVERYSDNVLALKNRGLCLHDLQKYDEANRDYKKAIELDGKDPEAWFQKGNLMLEQDLFAEAIADYDTVIQLESGYSKAWMNRGTAKYKSGRRVEGMKDLKHASELNENIVIPDIDWIEEPSEADVVIVAKPVYLADPTDWSGLESFAKMFLLKQGFGELTVTESFSEHKCAVLTATMGEHEYDIYVGHENPEQAAVVSLPAIKQPADGHLVSLLILKTVDVESDEEEKLKVALFNQEWDYSHADSSPRIIELRLLQPL